METGLGDQEVKENGLLNVSFDIQPHDQEILLKNA